MAASSSSTAEQPLCRLFSLADIQSATGGFRKKHVIGRGGFGKVYKAVIDGGSTTVAVKRLASNSNQGEREFAMEMETLTKVRHRNLVSLIGYCREEGEMILVYEYMANGTLADHLYKLSANIEPLSWSERLRICIGAGRGLDYLHSGCSIIHRDVKSTNILLDESFRAKVSDFGLAKHLGGDKSLSHLSASVKGSFGYFDPSYFTTGRLTRSSDVYAFGVVLLEVLSGRSALDRWMADEGYLCMSMWALEMIRSRKADQIVASDIKGEISESCLKTFVGVAKRCLHHEPKKRITMTQAVAQLELALEQQETRGTISTNRFRLWPFRSRAIASGSTQKDDREAIAFPENRLQRGVDAKPRDLLVDRSQKDEPESILVNATDIENKQRSVDVRREAIAFPGIENRRRGVDAKPRDLLVDHSQKDEPEAILVNATDLENKQRSVDKRPRALRVEHTVDGMPICVPAFPVAELEDITHNFSLKYLIAEGCKGQLIFRAVMKCGQDAIIEQFYKKLEESDTSFIEQVSQVYWMQHENFVQLLGYCTDGRMRALVFKCGPCGSLHAILHGPEPCPVLSWPQRIKIAAGVARGLCYLHDNNLIHRDIEPDKIFIFDNEIAKITHPHPKKNIPCSCKRFRFNYDGPVPYHEAWCDETSYLTEKNDVYDFGLVLLELLTGTQLFGCPRSQRKKQVFVSWAKVRLFQNRVKEVVDPRLKADYPLKPVEKMGDITKLCLHYDAYSRPDMTTVSQALQIASQETHDYYSQQISLSKNVSGFKYSNKIISQSDRRSTTTCQP